MKKGKNHYLFNFIICFAGFSVSMGLVYSVIFRSLVKGMVLGAFGGLLFAGLICGFVKIVSVRKDKLRERYGIEGNVSHSFNFMTGQCIILYSDIIKVTKGKIIRSIAIHLYNNKVEEFIVNNRKEWIDILGEKIPCYPMQRSERQEIK